VIKSFRKITQLLRKEHNILFDATQGKGSHGVLYGKNKQTGQMVTYPIPKHQQREIRGDYIKGIIRCFALNNDIFDGC
jgi:hypothetical protein